MAEKQQEMADTKTCPASGGTWPSDRRNCLACGANLESVPVRRAGEDMERDPLNWAWLDAMAHEETTSETPESVDDDPKPGCMAWNFSR